MSRAVPMYVKVKLDDSLREKLKKLQERIGVTENPQLVRYAVTLAANTGPGTLTPESGRRR